LSDPIVVVTLSERVGREYVDSEVPVSSLKELYEACRRAAPGRLSRVLLKGPEGEIRLHFGSLVE
jgi:hypothetical protein